MGSTERETEKEEERETLREGEGGGGGAPPQERDEDAKGESERERDLSSRVKARRGPAFGALLFRGGPVQDPVLTQRPWRCGVLQRPEPYSAA